MKIIYLIKNIIIKYSFMFALYILGCTLLHYIFLPHHLTLYVISVLCNAIVSAYLAYFLESILDSLAEISIKADFIFSSKANILLEHFFKQQIFKQEENHE